VANAAAIGEKSLSFQSLHTGENLKVTYWAQGTYLPDSCKQIDYLLRDWRTDDIRLIDRRLFDLLYDLRRMLGTTQPFQVISGYRSPKTNATLAARSRGVAKRSLHLKGKAIDVSLADRDLRHLRKAALALKAGGVGYYPRTGFVHLDTGRVRRWG
jgi:uncharacterized protein YcbK (DUF882 family)